MSDPRVRTTVVMDTQVSIRVVRDDDPPAVERAFDWFRRIEHVCSRFDPSSEVQQLATSPGHAFQASDILLQTTRFAVALAHDTDGAFDPAVGRRMEQRGFDRDYRTGLRIATERADDAASFRDIEIDDEARTIRLRRPLVIDLGAVAKGFAVDMAAQELRHLEHFAIDAGGDLYLAGLNERDEPWTVGIRHPRDPGATIDTISVSNAAVCTSGDYMRVAPGGGCHIIDPVSGRDALALLSVTVVAPLALVADGLATAAFVLGPERGLSLLERHGVQGLMITPDLERISTREP